MRIGMEILESQEAVVANFAEFFRNRWPISRSITIVFGTRFDFGDAIDLIVLARYSRCWHMV